MGVADWAQSAVFTWLSAYVIFFIGACVLLNKKATIPRMLIFIGTLSLVLVNLVMLAAFSEWFEMQYSPAYESPQWRTYMDQFPYPEWQRILYWGTVLMDTLGKILAGVGLILEGRQQVAIMRFRQMQLNQIQPNFTPR